MITLVGSPVTGSANSGNVTLTLPAGTSEGDVVVLWGGHAGGSGSNTPGPAAGSTGWTAKSVSTTLAPNYGVWYKRMSATPDTAVTCNGSGTLLDSTAYGVFVLRGVDAASPLSGINASNRSSDPSSITTDADFCWVLATTGVVTTDTTPGTIAGYGNTASAAGAGTNPQVSAGATKEVAVAGLEDPGAWSGWALVAESVYSVTIAFRPAPATVSPVGRSLQMPWNTRQVIDKPVQVLWNTRQAIGDPVQAIWDTRAAIADSLIAQWDIRQSVSDVLDVQWGAKALAGDDLQASWDTRAIVSDIIEPQWSVRILVGDPLEVLWNVNSAFTAVGRNLDTIWNTRAATGDVLDAVWGVRASVGDTLTTTWDIRVAIVSVLSVQWVVRALVGDALALVWTTEGLTGAPSSSQTIATIRDYVIVATIRNRATIATIRSRSATAKIQED